MCRITRLILLIGSKFATGREKPYVLRKYNGKGERLFVSIRNNTTHQLSHKMSMNKLQLNDDKAEIPLICSTAGMDLPSPLRVRQSDIPFSDAAHNLCVISESQLALKEEVNDLCQLAYLEIRFNPT